MCIMQGDSHHSNYFVKHGNENKVDVAFVGFGENPRGMTDKLTSSDVLRVAEELKTQVVIPIHHDIWSNFMADPKEITLLWNYRKDRMKYKFKYIYGNAGGKFVFLITRMTWNICAQEDLKMRSL